MRFAPGQKEGLTGRQLRLRALASQLVTFATAMSRRSAATATSRCSSTEHTSLTRSLSVSLLLSPMQSRLIM